jgi:uncharacterized Zn finger protein (UPF0148 family)
MKYKLGKTIWKESGLGDEETRFIGFIGGNSYAFSKYELVEMGATPIDSTCGKCGESCKYTGEHEFENTHGGVWVCSKCKLVVLKSQPKEEKIETINIKMDDAKSEYLKLKLNQVINAFNKLNKGE